MRVVSQKPWMWTLFEDDEGNYVLSSLCGTIAQYGIEVALSGSEAEGYLTHGNDAIDAFAQDVTRNPGAYAERSIDGFMRHAEVREAIDRWNEKSA
jgi:hypothetical protein